MGRSEDTGHHERHPRCRNHMTANNVAPPASSLVQSSIAPHTPSSITTPALVKFRLVATCRKTACKLVPTATMRNEKDKGQPFGSKLCGRSLAAVHFPVLHVACAIALPAISVSTMWQITSPRPSSAQNGSMQAAARTSPPPGSERGHLTF